MVRYLRSLTPKSSPTVKANITPGGSYFEAAPARPGSAASVNNHPFKVTNASDDETMQVAISYGTVNGLFPTVGGSAMVADPSPLLEVTDTGSVYIKVTADGLGSISLLDIVFYETGEVPFETWAPGSGGTGYLAIANVEVDTGAIVSIFNIISQNLSYTPAYGHLFVGY